MPGLIVAGLSSKRALRFWYQLTLTWRSVLGGLRFVASHPPWEEFVPWVVEEARPGTSGVLGWKLIQETRRAEANGGPLVCRLKPRRKLRFITYWWKSNPIALRIERKFAMPEKLNCK